MTGLASDDLRVTLHVQGEMIGSGERVIAHATDVRLVTGVFAMMTTQLVRTGELPLAAGPRAAERLFTCAVCSRRQVNQ
jgi:hypothetical protein